MWSDMERDEGAVDALKAMGEPPRPFTIIAGVNATGEARCVILDGYHVRHLVDHGWPLTTEWPYDDFMHVIGSDTPDCDPAKWIGQAVQVLLDWRRNELRERQIDAATGRIDPLEA